MAGRGEGWLDEGMSSLRKEGGSGPHSGRAPMRSQCGLKKIQHSVSGLISDTSLSKQAILQAISYVNTHIFCLILLSCSSVDIAIWFWTRHVLRYRAANHRRGTDKQASGMAGEQTSTAE